MFFMPWPLGLRMLCVWFWGLFCFGLPGPHFFCCGGWVGLGLVFWTVCTDCCSGLASCFVVWGWLGFDLLVLFGEFDPGSGRTLAACLTHASRTVKGSAFVGPG